MRLATLRDGTRDGALLVVGHDGRSCTRGGEIAPTLQAALDDWPRAAPALAALAVRLDAGTWRPSPSTRRGSAPLPRAYEWIDGSAFLNHVRLVRRARSAPPPPTLEIDPLVYQGGSGVLLGPRDDPCFSPIRVGPRLRERGGGDPRRRRRAERPRPTAAAHVRLLLLANDVTLRNLVPGELAKGFGFFQSKPATASRLSR